MTHTVHLQPAAEGDLNDAYLNVAKHAPETARHWVERFRESLNSLSSHPERCGFAPERKVLKVDLRQFHYGRRPNVFRAVFVIEGSQVYILRIYRASRDRLTPADLVHK